MFLELPPAVLSLLDGLASGMAELRAELREIRNGMRPAVPVATPRRQYSVEEVAVLLGKSPYTVREWCRHGQVNATKREARRGASALWSISSEEIDRYRNSGTLPEDMSRNQS